MLPRIEIADESYDLARAGGSLAVRFSDATPNIVVTAPSATSVALIREDAGAPDVGSTEFGPAGEKRVTFCVWPGDIAIDRVCGVFRLRFQVGEVRLDLTADVYPARLLDRIEIAAMHEAVVREFQAGVWGASGSPGRARTESAGHQIDDTQRVFDLIHAIEGEIEIARSLTRRPVRELGPLPLGFARLECEWAEGHTNSLDNAVMHTWCRRRCADAERVIAELDSWLVEVARLRSQDRESCGAGTPRSGFDDEEACLRRLRGRAVASIRRLHLLKRTVRHICEDFGRPPMPRAGMDQRSRMLAGSRRVASTRVSFVGDTLSTLPPAQIPALFGVWGGVAIAQSLRDLGYKSVWRTAGAGVVGILSIGRAPVPVRWQFQGDGLEIEVWSEPVIDLRTTRSSARMLLPRAERVAVESQVRGGWVASNAERSPDYLIRVQRGGRSAWCVGDATAADPKYAKGVIAKSDKVRKYVRTLRYVDTSGRVWAGDVRCSFVLVPGVGERWTSEFAAADEKHDVEVVASGIVDSSGASGVREFVARCIETLAFRAAQ